MASVQKLVVRSRVAPLTRIRPTDVMLNLDNFGFFHAYKASRYYLKGAVAKRLRIRGNDDRVASLEIRAGDIFRDADRTYWVLKVEKGHAYVRTIERNDIPTILRKLTDWQIRKAEMLNKRDEGKSETLAYSNLRIDFHGSRLLKGTFEVSGKGTSGIVFTDEDSCTLRCWRKPLEGDAFTARIMFSTIGVSFAFFKHFLVKDVAGDKVTVTCVSRSIKALFTK